MTMSGSKVESCESVGEDLTGVVTGRIVDIKKHPDADKLQICTVDIGSGHLTIVTGATEHPSRTGGAGCLGRSDATPRQCCSQQLASRPAFPRHVVQRDRAWLQRG